jgi:hypothetical protein
MPVACAATADPLPSFRVRLRMDYLRTLGSAAVSSLVQKSGLNLPFTLGAVVSTFGDASPWTLHEGTKRVRARRSAVAPTSYAVKG